MTMLDTEPVVLEELDLQPPCEGHSHGVPCPNPAKWVARFSCGSAEPICDEHRAWLFDVAIPIFGAQFRCTVHCSPQRDVALVDVVPL